MADSARYALHRPEVLGALERVEQKILDRLSGHVVRLTAGSTLIAAGQDHRYVYHLREGWAGRTRLLSDARNQFILIFLPGDLFAVKSMFMCQHPDDVRAISDIVVQRILAADLHAAFVDDGDVASRCIWQVMEEERRLHSWIVGLGQGSAEERVSMLLIDFRGRLTLSGSIETGALNYSLPMTQVQLADHLGITPVHLSRVLRNLRNRGVVVVENAQVNILNLAALRQIATVLLDPHDAQSRAYVGGTQAAPPKLT